MWAHYPYLPSVFLLHLIGHGWLRKQDAGFYDWLWALDPPRATSWSWAHCLLLLPLTPEEDRQFTESATDTTVVRPFFHQTGSIYILLMTEAQVFFWSEALSHSRSSATWWKFPGTQEKDMEFQFSSVQSSRSVMSDFMRPHESQHARLPCPSPAPRVHTNSCPSSWRCHPAISSSVVPFSSCPQSLPAWQT